MASITTYFLTCLISLPCSNPPEIGTPVMPKVCDLKCRHNLDDVKTFTAVGSVFDVVDKNKTHVRITDSKDQVGWVKIDEIVNLNDAIDYYSNSGDDVKTAWGLCQLGVAYAIAQKHDVALQSFNKAYKLDKDLFRLSYFRGRSYLASGELESALIDLTNAIEKEPTYSYCYYCRSETHFKMKKYDRAIEDCNNAIRVDKSNYSAFAYRANIYFHLRNYEKAYKDFDIALSSVSKLGDPAYVYKMRGILNYLKSDHVGAYNDFTKSVEYDSTNYRVFLYRAASSHYALDEKLISPRKDLEVANKLSKGTTGDVSLLKAIVCVSKTEYDKAIVEFQVALDDKTCTNAWCQYALFLSTCSDEKFRDGNAALKLVSAELKKRKIEQFSAHELIAIAATYAETGDFNNAILYQELNTKLKDQHTRETLILSNELLKLYKNKKKVDSTITVKLYIHD